MQRFRITGDDNLFENDEGIRIERFNYIIYCTANKESVRYDNISEDFCKRILKGLNEPKYKVQYKKYGKIITIPIFWELKTKKKRDKFLNDVLLKNVACIDPELNDELDIDPELNDELELVDTDIDVNNDLESYNDIGGYNK